MTTEPHTKIEWDEDEPGRFNSLCGNFTLVRDQLYEDVFHLRHAENDEYIDEGFSGEMTNVAARMGLPAREIQ